jgi:hypothetical protein
MPQPEKRKISVMIPLYIYPNDNNMHYFNKVAEASSKVDITAVINPSNGDFDSIGTNWIDTVDFLIENNITTLGYVYTSYAKRNLDDVKKNILSYFNLLHVNGIFFDEASYKIEDVEYYRELSSYMFDNTNYSLAVLNPGLSPDKSYVISENAPATEIVIYENPYSKIADHIWEPYIQENAPENFICLIYETQRDDMQAAVDQAIQMNCAQIFVTDRGWNELPSYFDEFIEYIYQQNR